jgi:hypothetical protein
MTTPPFRCISLFIIERALTEITAMKMRLAEFVRLHPFCCFCGGKERTQSMDHQPARIMFPRKHRPKGLEFPACTTCNKQTAPDEALVALFARVAGSNRPHIDAHDTALDAVVKAVRRSFPLLLSSITHTTWIMERGVLRRTIGLNGNHPQVDKSVCRVAAKLALAAYYDHHKTAAPPTVKINTMWSHNQNRNANLAITNLLGSLPKDSFLRQGKSWNTQDTFFFRYHAEGDVFIVAAILHECVALMAHIAPSTYVQNWTPWHHVWAPVPGNGIRPFVSPSLITT